MTKFFYLFLALVVGAALYWIDARQDMEREETGKLAFSLDIDALYNALLEARDQSLSVELGRDRWAVLQGGNVVRHGELKNGERLGTNIAGSRLAFDKAGPCPANKAANVITVASDVNRIYTITFDDSCKPVIGYDDF